MLELLSLLTLFSVLQTNYASGEEVLYDFDKPISVREVTSPFGQYVALGLHDLRKAPGFVHPSSKCLLHARNIEEPYTSRYWPQKKLNLSYPWTEVKRALWEWNGPITQELFDREKQRKPPACPGCAETVHIKILGGRLWVSSSALPSHGLNYLEEMLKVTLYLFDVPDMEFLAFIGDACNPNGKPALAYSICRNASQPGFTMPTSGMWGHSLGPVQMAAYHSCLAHKFPLNNRQPQAVWRGSSTYQFGIRKDNYLKAPRVQLHLMGRSHPDLLDAKLVKILSPDREVHAALSDTAPFMSMEDYNNYCAVLHLDGNGWSDRFVNSLVHYPTPVLRAATNRFAAVEHLFAPGDSIELFDPGLGDLLEKVRDVVEDCRRGDWAKRRALVRQKQRLARLLLDQVGVIELLAYSLEVYRNLTTFPVDTSTEGFREVNMTCCTHTSLPPRFAAAVSSRLDPGGSAAQGLGQAQVQARAQTFW